MSIEAEAMFLDGKRFEVLKMRPITHPLNGDKEVCEIILKVE